MGRLLLCLLLLCTATACRHGPKIERTLNLPSSLEVSAITVEPLAFRWEQPAYRSLEVAQRMVDEAVRVHGASLLFFGSWEATEFGEVQPKMKQTPVLAMLAPYGLGTERLLQFRPWVETRILSGQTAVEDSAGKTAGKARNEERSYIGHLEVVAASSAELVAEFSGEVEADPFAEVGDDGDPAPELTRLMIALTNEALSSLRGQFRLPAAPPREFDGRFWFAPQRTFMFVQRESEPSLQDALLKGDALDQEVAKRDRILFANPGISDDVVAKLSTTRGGLFVDRADQVVGLNAGDLILEIDRKPALRQHFHRALLSPNPTELLVKRADGEETIVILK